MVILRSSSWNGSIDLAAFFKSQFYLSQLERLRPIHMNTMEFHSVVAKSIFGAKLSNVNKPISRISDVTYLAETYQPSWNLFWYVSRAGTIWCQTNVQNLKGMIMKGWPRRYKYLVILMKTPEHWFQKQDQFGPRKVREMKWTVWFAFKTNKTRGKLCKSLRDGSGYQNGWIFGKLPRGTRVIFNPENYFADFGPLYSFFSSEISEKKIST